MYKDTHAWTQTSGHPVYLTRRICLSFYFEVWVLQKTWKKFYENVVFTYWDVIEKLRFIEFSFGFFATILTKNKTKESQKNFWIFQVLQKRSWHVCLRKMYTEKCSTPKKSFFNWFQDSLALDILPACSALFS